ncbi:protein-glutamate O-methyltransferase CheR [Pelomonas sp. KK5]|uniref:CheR family methyltransferase n=1 Tax=Pelomonas sp. KK5 TaxID=1855730 RepID=UPI0009F88F2D|nr:protein-glutamate O-methyltransferase CheR [Pelomonas sp. KK5]
MTTTRSLDEAAALAPDPAAAEALARFRDLVLRRLGLEFQDRQAAMLDELLQRRSTWHRLTPESYLNALHTDLLPHEFEALAPELTTAETYFFRNIEQFHALRERVLPELLHARRYTRSLRILSAGCASGEEIYTVAMLMQDLTPDRDWDISLLGVDLNPEVLRRARSGRYTSWSLRETPENARHRWFRPEGSEFVLDPKLRAAVRFEMINLNEPAPHFWRPGAFDVIFARNVLMYFNRAALHDAVARMTQALAPDGYFFLGHSESLRDLTRTFQLCHTHGTFYYRRCEGGAAPARPAFAPAAPSTAWVETIDRSSERVRDLTATGPAAAAITLPAAIDHFEEALDLFAQERFEAADACLSQLDSDCRRHPDALLLRAMLRLHDGEFSAAEDLAHEVLTHDVRSAAAHYVIALCRESNGDGQAALHRFEQACRLDSGFALPHLHRGRLARQRGDAKAHRHELARALDLLEHESPQRLLMFGGGFDRIALQNMCRSELRAAEGRKTR